MSAKISSQSSALTGQSAAEALLRNEKSDKSTETIAAKPKKKLDESYELNLSETAQSMMSSALPAVSTPDEAQKQMALIKAASEQSSSSTMSAQKPTAKAVMDLLA